MGCVCSAMYNGESDIESYYLTGEQLEQQKRQNSSCNTGVDEKLNFISPRNNSSADARSDEMAVVELNQTRPRSPVPTIPNNSPEEYTVTPDHARSHGSLPVPASCNIQLPQKFDIIKGCDLNACTLNSMASVLKLINKFDASTDIYSVVRRISLEVEPAWRVGQEGLGFASAEQVLKKLGVKCELHQQRGQWDSLPNFAIATVRSIKVDQFGQEAEGKPEITHAVVFMRHGDEETVLDSMYEHLKSPAIYLGLWEGANYIEIIN